MLKKIECFIQPSKLEGIKTALVEMGVGGMTVTDVRGFGQQRGFINEKERNKAVKFLPKTKLEIIVNEEIVEDVIAKVKTLARTGTIGAGKIFVIPVEDAIRVRTDETGRRAIR